MLELQQKHWLNLLLISLIVFFSYLPGIHSQFQFDDTPNIILNERIHLESLSLENIARATLSGDSGLLKRPISMLSFAVNYYFAALNPLPYKLTNLFIHIVNAWAVYWLSLVLLQRLTVKENGFAIIYSSPFAFFIALTWAVHPINLTSVLYVVQRMTSLSACFALIGMILYVLSRNALNANKINKGLSGLCLVLVSGLLAVFSKENGALLIAYLLLIELVFYRNKLVAQKPRLIIYSFFGLTLAIPGLLIIVYSLIKPEWLLSSYGGTAFTLGERVLTEYRIVWHYISWILLPNNQSLGLFHDDISLSTSLFDATYPLIAALGHLGVIGCLLILWVKDKQPLFVFGCGLFYASHLMESTILPLELVHEHRNYLGSFGLILAFGSLFLSANDKVKQFASAGTGLYILFLTLITLQRATHWGNGIEGALIEVQHHPDSAATHYEVGRQYASLTDTEHTHFQEKALEHFQIASELDKSRADSIFAIIITSARNKTAINPALVNELINRLKNGPAYASHATWLSTLISCYTNAKCTMEETQIVAILQAALENKNLHNNKLTESFTLMATSGFLTSGGNNYNNALELSIIAAESCPGNVIFIRHIINLAIAFKDFDTASQWIKHLENQTYSFLFTQEIQSLKNKLPSQSEPIATQ